MKTEALAIQEPQFITEPTPLSLIQSALHKGVSPEVLKELVALQQSMVRFEWEAQERQAKIDFDNALSRCQSKVSLLKPNQGRKSSRSATQDNIFWLDYVGLDAEVRPIYLAEGFSISFSEAKDGKDNYVGMMATLSRGGISREYFRRLTLAPSFEGMPKADAEASAASRVKRYLILQIFNVAVGIDKDEKKAIPENGKLAGWLKSMRDAKDPGELDRAYKQSFLGAEKEGDKVAMFDIMACNKAEKARYK
jgi:hypothetical protein